MKEGGNKLIEYGKSQSDVVQSNIGVLLTIHSSFSALYSLSWDEEPLSPFESAQSNFSFRRKIRRKSRFFK